MSTKKNDFRKTLALKHEELELLASHLERSPKIPLSTKRDFKSFFDCKVQLMRTLRAQSFQELAYANSNVGKLTTDWHGFKFYHRYSRQGDPIVGKNVCKLLYPTAPAGLRSDGMFVASGQAATLTAFVTLTKRFRLRPRVVEDKIYFETMDLVDQLPDGAYQGAFRFCDSSSPEFSWATLAAGEAATVLVFDTTCVDRQDPGFSSFLKKIHKESRPVILVRSCLKLDSFGAEYGALGSIVVLNPGSFPSAPVVPESSRPSAYREITQLLKFVGGTLGAFPSIDCVYPFLTNVRVTDLNTARTQRIQANAETLRRYLLAFREEVVMRPHRLFCQLPSYGHADPAALNRLAQKISLVTGFPIYMCETFGLDVAGVTSFLDFYSLDKKPTLRFAPPDLCPDEFAESLDVYASFMKSSHE